MPQCNKSCIDSYDSPWTCIWSWVKLNQTYPVLLTCTLFGTFNNRTSTTNKNFLVNMHHHITTPFPLQHLMPRLQAVVCVLRPFKRCTFDIIVCIDVCRQKWPYLGLFEQNKIHLLIIRWQIGRRRLICMQINLQGLSAAGKKVKNGKTVLQLSFV